MASRIAAARILDAILRDRLTLDEALDGAFAGLDLDARDRGFARLLASTVLRGHGQIEAVLARHLRKIPREGSSKAILQVGAAQLLFLDTPPHAAISLAVDQVREDHRTRHLSGLVNAVLRKIAVEGAADLAAGGGALTNIPAWMFERWKNAYGADTAEAIARASLREAPLDIAVRSEPEEWARRLNGVELPHGAVRLRAHGPVEDLDGYDDGQWWVQDAAAQLPARLLFPVEGRTVADLCAAPGGKTAELAIAGARVTAVEISEARARRLRANIERLRLDVAVVIADAETWTPPRTFDAVLLDAPCSATGTIRRHPDILHLKTPGDIARLATTQTRLLESASRLVGPGGTIVYCTCSMEPEEGPERVAEFLKNHPEFARRPVSAKEVGSTDFITPEGDFRSFPYHMPQPADASPDGELLSGMDGFYAARLTKVT